MIVKNQKGARRLKIKKRIRKIIHGTFEKPRLSVYKSNTSIYAQLIDDDRGKTIFGLSLKKINIKKNNVIGAKELGKAIGEKILAQGINTIVFDRSGYIYHGKVKALSEGVREQGIKF